MPPESVAGSGGFFGFKMFFVVDFTFQALHFVRVLLGICRNRME